MSHHRNAGCFSSDARCVQTRGSNRWQHCSFFTRTGYLAICQWGMGASTNPPKWKQPSNTSVGDDDVTNCCHGDLVFEITSNGEGKERAVFRNQSRGENEKGKGEERRRWRGWRRRKGALMFHVGEEKGEKWPCNVGSIQCPHTQFSDVNTSRFIYSRTGLHPLRLSVLILQLQVFKMDFYRTQVTITKVTASQGLSLCSLKRSLYTEGVTNCSDKKSQRVLSTKFNYVDEMPIKVGKCRPTQNDYSLGQKALPCKSSKSEKLHDHVFLDLYLPWAAVSRMYLSLQSPPGSSHQALSVKEVAWLACVCRLLEQCYPTASAESVSAVFMLCQGDAWPQTVASALPFV